MNDRRGQHRCGKKQSADHTTCGSQGKFLGEAMHVDLVPSGI